MTFDNFVNAALIFAAIVVLYGTGQVIAQFCELGKYRKPKRCTVRKVWDSEEPKDV